MTVKFTPLDSTFTLVSIIGFFVSVLYIMPYINRPWGFAFTIFFFMLFTASMISMTKADTSPGSIDSLAIKRLKKK